MSGVIRMEADETPAPNGHANVFVLQGHLEPCVRVVFRCLAYLFADSYHRKSNGNVIMVSLPIQVTPLASCVGRNDVIQITYTFAGDVKVICGLAFNIYSFRV